MDTNETPRTLDTAAKAAVKAAFDRLRGSFAGYKPRASQNRMIGAAARGLGSAGGIAVIEAPTGTGKSMAYLTAAIPLALAQSRTVVISTATVALQEQIFARDLPAFLKATGLEATVALAKGRQRYACVSKLLELGGEQSGVEPLCEEMEVTAWSRPPLAEEVAAVQALVARLDDESWDGDLDNPPLELSDGLRQNLNNPEGACTGPACPNFRQCPVMRARKAIREAQVIVSNHNLTLASLAQAAESGPAGEGESEEDTDSAENFMSDPARTLYVFDEGHHLGRIAVDASASSVHLGGFIKRMGGFRKLVMTVFRLTAQERMGGLEPAQAQQVVASAVAEVGLLLELLEAEWDRPAGDNPTTLRMPLGRLPAGWRAQASSTLTHVRNLHRLLGGAEMAVAQAHEMKRGARDRLRRQLGMAAHQVQLAEQLLQDWCRQDEGVPTARWLSAGADGAVIAHASQITAAPHLNAVLWPQADSVLVTSATLSTGGDFGLLVDELGLPDSAELASLSSPFNLAEQAVLRVPAFPVLPDAETHAEEIARWLEKELDWSEATLVLFSSRRKMAATAAALPANLRLMVQVQGDSGKAALLVRHCDRIGAGQGSVLFGLVSFGEGLDLPGDMLTHVVCTQTPFAVPDDPVGKTLAEWLQANGQDPFNRIAVPAATRTLIQYTGRLIRTELDTGKVTLLDRRLVTRSYGRRILNALPPFRRDITR